MVAQEIAKSKRAQTPHLQLRILPLQFLHFRLLLVKQALVLVYLLFLCHRFRGRANSKRDAVHADPTTAFASYRKAPVVGACM